MFILLHSVLHSFTENIISRRDMRYHVESVLVSGEDVWEYRMMPMDIAQGVKDLPEKCVKQETRVHRNSEEKDIVVCWDSVFLAGVSKGGTTALYAALKSHPSISSMIPRKKEAWEMHFFDRVNEVTSWINGTAQSVREKYLDKHSPNVAVDLAERGAVPLLLHYTPGYLFYAPAAINIWRLHPFLTQIRFLVNLREPVSRMWSSYEYKHFRHHRRILDLRHPMTEFEEQWQDVDKVASCIEHAEGWARDGEKWDVESAEDLHTRKCPFNWSLGVPTEIPKNGVYDTRRNARGQFHHVGKGVYYLQFKVWFRLFDRRQFYVASSERLREGADVHEDMVRWLGLPLEGISPEGFHGFESLEAFRKAMQSSGDEDEDEAANITPEKRRIEDVLTPAQIASITERYKPWNRRLNKMLGIDFGYPT